MEGDREAGVWGDEEDGRRCWWGRGNRKWIGVRVAGEMRVLKRIEEKRERVAERR